MASEVRKMPTTRIRHLTGYISRRHALVGQTTGRSLTSKGLGPELNRPQRRPPRFFEPPRDALDAAAGSASASVVASSAAAGPGAAALTADSPDGQCSRHS